MDKLVKYMSKIEKSPSMADVICDLRVRKIKSVFFHQLRSTSRIPIKKLKVNE